MTQGSFIKAYQRIAGALSGAAAALLAPQRVLYFDELAFDVDDQPATTISNSEADAEGIATGVTHVSLRASSLLALSDATPVDVLASSTGAAQGVATAASRADHTHAVPVATNGSTGFAIGRTSSSGEASKFVVYDINGAITAAGFGVGALGTTLNSFLAFPPYDLGEGGPTSGALPAADGLTGSPVVFAELSGTTSQVPAPTNWPVGSLLILAFKQGSGGGKTISAWNAAFKFGTVTNALLGSAAGDVDVYVFLQLFLGQWLAVARGKV